MEDSLKHYFDYVARQIEAADSIPALLTSAFIGLELIERAATALAGITTDDPRPGHEKALTEATDAWWALSEAPTLAWPDRTSVTTSDDARQFAETIADFVLVVTKALLNVASKSSDPGDRVACLRAAHHTGHVHSALR